MVVHRTNGVFGTSQPQFIIKERKREKGKRVSDAGFLAMVLLEKRKCREFVDL